MMKRLLVAAALVAAGLLLPAGTGWAQSTGAVRGRVVDEKGQGLQDAVVTIDFQGGVTRKFDTKTNKKGEFTQVGLAPGPYRITANKDGYQGNYIDMRVSLGEPSQLPDFKLVSKAAAQAAGSSEQDKALAVVRELFQKATQLSQEGKYDEAIAAYNDVLAKNPNVAEAHLNLGYIYRQKKDWAAAEAAYKKALEVRPGYSEANAGLLGVYQESGQADKATALAASAEGDPKVQFNMGVSYFNAGKYDEAMAAFQKAAAADPTNPDPYYHMGAILVSQNKIPEARTSLEKFLSMNPKNAQYVATAQGLLQALPKK